MNDASGQSIRQAQLTRKKQQAQAVKEAKRRDDLRGAGRNVVSPPIRIRSVANEADPQSYSFSPALSPSSESWTAKPLNQKPAEPESSTLELMFDPSMNSGPESPESEAILTAAVAATAAIEGRAAAESKAEIVAEARAALAGDAAQSAGDAARVGGNADATEPEIVLDRMFSKDPKQVARGDGHDSNATSEEWRRGQEIRRQQMQHKQEKRSNVLRACQDHRSPSPSNTVPATIWSPEVEELCSSDKTRITPRRSMEVGMAEPVLKDSVSLQDVSKTSRGCRGCIGFGGLFSSFK